MDINKLYDILKKTIEYQNIINRFYRNNKITIEKKYKAFNEYIYIHYRSLNHFEAAVEITFYTENLYQIYLDMNNISNITEFFNLINKLKIKINKKEIMKYGDYLNTIYLNNLNLVIELVDFIIKLE